MEKEDSKPRASLVRQSSVNRKVGAAEGTHKATLFCDSRGNVKFVNAVVKCPCIVLLIVNIVMFSMTGWLIARNGASNPITEGTHNYVLSDIRSERYDALSLASGAESHQVESDTNDDDESSGRRLETVSCGSSAYWGEGERNRQEEQMDVMMYAFESEGKSMFNSKQLTEMREFEQEIIAHNEYIDYCLADPDTLPAFNCSKPISATNIYYASYWNHTMVQEVIDALAEGEHDPGNYTLYNTLGYCVEYGVYCSSLSAGEKKYLSWASDISTKITTIMSTWDGEGEQNSDLAQVTEFCAYMKLLTTRQYNVDFFFDKKFSLSNQNSVYSRSIVYFGGPNKECDESQDLTAWVIKNFYKFLETRTQKDYSDTSNTYYVMAGITFDVFLQLILVDMGQAFGSIIVVFFYLVFQTRRGFWPRLACLRSSWPFRLPGVSTRVSSKSSTSGDSMPSWCSLCSPSGPTISLCSLTPTSNRPMKGRRCWLISRRA